MAPRMSRSETGCLVAVLAAALAFAGPLVAQSSGPGRAQATAARARADRDVRPPPAAAPPYDTGFT